MSEIKVGLALLLGTAQRLIRDLVQNTSTPSVSLLPIFLPCKIPHCRPVAFAGGPGVGTGCIRFARA